MENPCRSPPDAMMTDYIPVDCGLHSEFELAILRRSPMRLRWEDAAGRVRVGLVTPVDLQTRQHEEYLVVRDREQRYEIRLDRIRHHELLQGEDRANGST